MSKIESNYIENSYNDFKNFEFTNILKRLNLILLNKSGLCYLEEILKEFEVEFEYAYSEVFFESSSVISLFSYNYKNLLPADRIDSIRNIFQKEEFPLQILKKSVKVENTILLYDIDKQQDKTFIFLLCLKNENSLAFISKIFDIYFPAIKHNIESINQINNVFRNNQSFAPNNDLSKVLSDDSPTGIMQLDKDMKIIYKNSALMQMMNDPIDSYQSFIGRSLFELESVQSANLIPLIHRINKGEIITDYQTEFNSIYGSNLNISIHSIPLFDYNNSFNGAIISIKNISQEIKYKNALLNSENRFRAVFNSAVDAISVHDFKTGRIEDVNQAFINIFCYTKEELASIGFNYFAFFDEANLDKAYQSFEILEVDNYIQFEWLATKKSGETFWADITLKKVYIAEELKVVANIRDISSRKNYLKELDESRTKYKALFETAGDSILLIQDEKIIECNRQTYELFKCSPEEIIGCSPMEISPDLQINGGLSLELGRTNIEKAKKEGSQTFEWQHLSYDGQIFDVEIVLSVIDVEKNLLIAILRDIRDRKAFLTQLMYEKAFSDALINSMPAIFFIYSPEGRLIKWNTNMELFTGYSSEELYDFNILDWFDGYSKEKIIEDFPKLFTEDKPLSLILNTIMKSRNSVPYLYTVSTFEIDGIKYAIGTGIDISEWKYVEEAYVQSEEKYKNLVDNAVEGILIIQDKKIKYANPISESILEASISELLEADIQNYIDESDVNNYIVKSDDILLDKNSLDKNISDNSTVFKIRSNDNNIKWVECKSIEINWQNSPATLLFLSDITNRKIAEQALFESENALKMFINALPTPAFLIGIDRKIMVANKALALRYDTDMASLMGTDVFLYLEEPHRSIRISQLQTCIETQQSIISEDIRNGKYYIDHFYPIINAEGEVYNIAMISVDITDLKQIEKQLAISEERYRNLFENANEAIVVIQDENIVLCNKKTNEIIRDNNIRLDNRSFFEIIHPEDKRMLVEINQQRYKNGNIGKKFRFRIITDEDKILCLESSTVLIEFEGKPATLSFINDITIQLEAENKIYLQNYAMDSAIYAIAIFDLDGHITYINNAFVELFGFKSREELLNTNIYNYEHYFNIQDITKVVINQGESVGEVPINSNKDVWVQYSISLVNDKIGKPIQIMASFINISQRKIAQAEIYKLNLELEEKVIERTSELNETLQKLETSNYELLQLNEELATGSRTLLKLNQKLSESQNELKIANDTKDKFLSILAHDLKNPLQSIIMVSEILNRYGASLDIFTTQSKISQIYDTAIKINDLLNNLLTWSKSQSGRIEFKPENIKINELFEKSITLFSGLAQQKQIKIVNNIEFCQELYLDKNLIDTVIRNLISNAIKFTNPNGSIEISLIIENDYFNFSIKDTGIGISVEDINKLFRMDISHTTIGTSKEKGTGLGLLLCKEFIEKHNGKINVNSKIGIGTEFIFSLPKNI